MDGGTRTPADYHRLSLAVTEVARSMEANIFPLNISGENCTYCQFRRDICGGTGLPPTEEDES